MDRSYISSETEHFKWNSTVDENREHAGSRFLTQDDITRRKADCKTHIFDGSTVG